MVLWFSILWSQYCFILFQYSLVWNPVLSHLVSYQPRLFIAKCCCQPRWRPPPCWRWMWMWLGWTRWMWMWHKILMSNSPPASNTLPYQASLRRTFSAPGPGMVLFSVPCGMPGNGSAIIHAHSSSRLIISGVSLIHQRYLHNTHRSEFFRSRLPVQKKGCRSGTGFEAQIGNPRHFYNLPLSSWGAPVPQMHPGPLNIRKASVNFRLCNSGNIFEFVYCCAKFVLVEADSTHNYWEANFTTQIGVQHNSTTLGNKQTNAELWVYALRTTAAVQQMHGQITFQFQILYSALTL